MSSKKKPALDDMPFYMEESGWPFMHYMIAMALAATRVLPIWARYLAMYVWESIECSISEKYGYFKEQRSDSLIGDILVGGTAITTFTLLDKFLLNDKMGESFDRLVPWWVRIAVLSVLFVTSFLFEKLNEKKSSVRIGSAIYGIFYIGWVGGIIAGFLLFSNDEEKVSLSDKRDIAIRTTVWLTIAALQTFVSTFAVFHISSFMAVLFVGTPLLFGSAALVLLAVAE
jgi:hypothetical protein